MCETKKLREAHCIFSYLKVNMKICKISHFGLDVSAVKVRSFDHLLTHCFDRLDLLIVSLHLGKDVVDFLEVDEDTVLVVLDVLDLKDGLLLFNPFYHL